VAAPSRYQEIGRELADQGVLSLDEGKKLCSMAGLRNILVRVYAQVDHERLYSLLWQVEELEEIMRKLLNYIEREGLDP